MNIAVILGADCDAHLSEHVAQWVANQASDMEGVDVDLVDLKDYSLSIFDEPTSPCQYQSKQTTKTAQEWLETVDKADAYVFVTPEHNRSIPSALKKAFDYITWEMSEKPAAIVSYGSVGGHRAAKYLQEIIRETQAVPIPAHVAIFGIRDTVNESDTSDAQILKQAFGAQPEMKSMLRELGRYRDVLTAAGAYA